MPPKLPVRQPNTSIICVPARRATSVLARRSFRWPSVGHLPPASRFLAFCARSRGLSATKLRVHAHIYCSAPELTAVAPPHTDPPRSDTLPAVRTTGRQDTFRVERWTAPDRVDHLLQL